MKYILNIFPLCNELQDTLLNEKVDNKYKLPFV